MDLFLLHLMYLYDSDVQAAIIKPITTIMSLSPNLFSLPLSVSVCLTTDFPPSALTGSPCGGCGHSVWVTWGAAGLLHYLPPLPLSSLLILQSGTSHHRSPPLLQYPAAKPLGLKIELINTFSKYKWDDCLLMDCLSFGSAFKESVW